MKKTFIIFLTFLNLVSFSKTFAENIPTIVISAGKTLQSIDTVGSTIEVIDSDAINNSSYSLLADVINDNSTSTNLFRMGGAGTNTGVQLRGLEKRYSTVYVDGVKMMDPSSSDGSFYLDNLTKNGIERVEVLKGTQSSLYGSNAIGGTINIFTKKGREGNHQSVAVETATNNTKNINYSLDGANEKFNYFLGLNKYVTDGISAMNDNNEKDEYKNDGVVGNFGYKINDNFSLQNSFRYADTFLEYDTVDNKKADGNSTDNIEASNSLKLIYEKNKFKNTLSYNKFQIERYNNNNYKNKKQNYFGYRDSLNFVGEYNINLDNKIVYGVESEVDASRYNRSTKTYNLEHDEGIVSQYFDYQFRPFEKMYSSFGLRSDDHTTVGRKMSGRGTIVYKLDGDSKVRTSFGSGVRMPSMYDYSYAWNTISDGGGGTKEDLQAERGQSFDLGYDTFVSNLDLGLGITYFQTEQKNPLISDARGGWVMRNITGRNTSEGVELASKWKPLDKKYNLNFGYTFTDSYDANTCDQDSKDSWSDNECRNNGLLATAKVRVPRHAVQARFNYRFNKDLASSIAGKYSGRTRDFGNDNNNWRDETLRSYVVIDLVNSYNLFDGYKVNLNINNIFDEKYEQAYEYSTPRRSVNLGFKKVY
jgi:vitamin B12 transporter